VKRIFTTEQLERRIVYRRQYYLANRNEIKAKVRQHRKENRDKQNAYNRQYVKDHREELSAKRRQHYKDNREEIKAKNKQRKKRITPSGLTTEKADNLHKYGITPEHFNSMQDSQGFVCSICGWVLEDSVTGKAKTLNVDHCHRTNTVRGLLCNNCNRALGYFQDSATILRKAVAYLDHFTFIDQTEE